MWEVWQLNTLIKSEKSTKNWIDQHEAWRLQNILDSNKDNKLDENTKEILQNKQSIALLVNWIKNYLNAPKQKATRLQGMSSKYLNSYKNVLGFLNDSVDNASTWDKRNQLSPDDKLMFKAEIWSLIEAIDKQMPMALAAEKLFQDAADDVKFEIQWPVDFINFIKSWLNSNKDTYGLSIINNLFDGSPDLVYKTLKMFIENYNSNNTNKLKNKNLIEQMYNISPEQKDLFSWYLAEVIVANAQLNKSSLNTLNTLDIPKFRKAIYPLLFKANQEVPLLLSQKHIIVWDKSGTLGIVPGYESNPRYNSFWVNLFKYDEAHPGQTLSNIGWLPWQKTMDISFLASWVDGRWANINIKIWDVLIKWITKWATLNSRNQTDQNLITWNIVSWEPPKWLSITDWSIRIDSEKYWSKPIIAVDINSIGGDEVMVRAATNWQFVDKSIAWNAEVSGKGIFESWKRELNEEGKKTFAEQVKWIRENINVRLPNWTKLLVNMWSWVDQTRVAPGLANTLKTEISKLKESLKWYGDLIKDMESKSETWWFIDEWNKLLAQARFLTGLKYMVENLQKDSKSTNTYLDKVEFNVTKIEQTKDKRYFDFEMSKYAIPPKATA